MRCLTLANTLKSKDVETIFVCHELEGHLCEYLEEQSFKVGRLKNDDGKWSGSIANDLPGHSAWLNTSWQYDAEQTCDIIDGLDVTPEWVIVDHYSLDHRWEDVVRRKTQRIMVIDDLADRKHNADLILDQNLIANYRKRYSEKVPAECRLMLGTEYALLQPDYVNLYDRVPPRSGQIKRIMVFFGGADVDNLTSKVINVFQKIGRKDINLDVVLTSNNPYFDAISQQVENDENIQIFYGLRSLAPLISKSDLAIGASGTTSWERCCLGLPSLIISLATNQIPIAKEMHRTGLINWLGHKDEVDESIIENSLRTIIEAGLDKEWSQKCRMYVDGLGVYRVCHALLADEEMILRARHARPDDKKHFAKLVQAEDEVDVDVENNSWFYEDLRDPDMFQIYMIETDDRVSVGHVCFKLEDEVWAINYYLGENYRNQDIDQSLLVTGIVKLRVEKKERLVFDYRSLNSKSGIEGTGISGLESQSKNEHGLSIGVCTSRNSWINVYIPRLLLSWLSEGHRVTWVHDANDLLNGDICFYLGYGSIVKKTILKLFQNNLVVHESALPQGRGWSPLTWQILEKASNIPVTLFEAEEKIDSGAIYLQEIIRLSGDELIDELRNLQSEATINLCCEFVNKYPDLLEHSRAQSGEASYYPRRYEKDSQLDVDKSLREQFDALRVADNQRYPAWFEINDRKYTLHINKS
jgi:UDP-2,4-diacetamido-2,4,6-trideoxy-beta-L-altropyranose hydrolase